MGASNNVYKISEIKKGHEKIIIDFSQLGISPYEFDCAIMSTVKREELFAKDNNNKPGRLNRAVYYDAASKFIERRLKALQEN
jgi:hypothetical protein